MPGKTNWKTDRKQLTNPASCTESIREPLKKKMREITEQLFTIIESKLEKIKNTLLETSRGLQKVTGYCMKSPLKMLGSLPLSCLSWSPLGPLQISTPKKFIQLQLLLPARQN